MDILLTENKFDLIWAMIDTVYAGWVENSIKMP